MSNHGGARKGAGRKKGVGRYFTLKKVVSDCFDDMFESLLEDDRTRKIIIQEINQKELFNNSGMVYVIKNLQNGLYKIGITSIEPKRRFSHYRTHTEINLICMYELNDYEEVEIFLHEKYCDHQERGEWFSLNENQVLDVVSYLTKEKHKEVL